MSRYDPKLHGVDWDAKVQQAHEKIKQEKSLNMAMAHVAAGSVVSTAKLP
jgi:hypothetical protein